MEIFLAEKLKDCIATLDRTEKVIFWGFDISTLFSLSRTSLCFSFLHAVVRCWDRITHVFRFGAQDMCPTLEEFQALMESRHDEEIMPQLHFDHAQALGWMCGLTVHEARSLAHNGELDIPDLIHQFSDIGNRGDLLWQDYRQHPSFYVCLRTFFFPLVAAEPTLG
ncbi:hypothetical protein ACSBR1_027438 [Camellia fascicularis]